MPITSRRTGRTLAVVVATALVAGSGCTSTLGAKRGEKSFTQQVTDTIKSTLNSSYHDDDADVKMTEAEQRLAEQDYKTAQALYGDLADNTYNSTQMREKARFQEGECCRLQNKLPAAVATYHRYLQDHPGGVYSKQAAERMYAIAEMWLPDVLASIEGNTKWWDIFPRGTVSQSGIHGEVGAEVSFGKGKTKANAWGEASTGSGPSPLSTSPESQLMGITGATTPTRPFLDAEGELVKTFENIAVGAPNAPCAEKAMFWAGYLHYARGRYEDADHFFSTLAEMYKDSPLRQEAVKYAIDAKTRVTGGALYDGQKANEALQLVHNLEASEPTYRNDPAKQEWATKQKLSIRGSQAERDFETAEYYKRTSRHGSAFFYYELVKRRYPGTKYSDLASERIEEIRRMQAQKAADKAAGKVNPLEVVQERLDNLFGNHPKPENEPSATPTQTRPTGAPIVPAAGGFDGR